MKTFLTIHPLIIEGKTEPHQIEPYYYPVFSYSFLMEGEVLVSIEDKNYLLGAGQFILVPENKTIVIKHFKDCRGYMGGFSLSELKDASYPVLRTKEPVIQSFWFDDAVFLGVLLKRMLVASEDNDKALLRCGIDMILSQLRPGGQVAAIPEKFMQMVFEKNNATFSVSDYANLLKVTPNYLVLENEDGSVTFYRYHLFFECAEENKRFYADEDGRLCAKSADYEKFYIVDQSLYRKNDDFEPFEMTYEVETKS